MDQGLERALAWLSGQGAEMERSLGSLVDQNSWTEHRAGADAVAGLLRELFALPGLDCERHRVERFGEHLVFSTARAGQGDLLLIGHHDTVFPPGTFEGWSTEDELGRGPGCLDMKGGLVVVRFALAALAEAGWLDRVAVRVVSVSDEEVGSPTSRAILAALCGSAAGALVFESGRMSDAVVTTRKGVGQATVTARGRAAHAGARHDEGRNAIWALARFVDRAQRLTDYARGITINVGKIEGGVGKNTVPELARAFVDLRFVAPEDGAWVTEALREAGSASAAEVEGTTVEVDAHVSRPPMTRTPASARLYEEYAACARAAGLGHGEAPLTGGGSDANTVSALGVAAIDALGPRGSGFHTRDEHIVRASLVPKAEALVRFLWGRAASFSGSAIPPNR